MKLDAAELIAAARARTGLEDLGAEDVRQGLERLVAALESEADLTETGRDAARGRLRGLLEKRLRIEDWIRTHPEVEREPVEAPIFVIGMPRTGTTALSQLLGCDPETRSLRAWESSQPVPPPESATEHTDPRIAATQAGIDAMSRAHPEWPRMHDGTATTPTECLDLLGMVFRTWHFCGEYWIPGYDAWQRDCDMEPAYRVHRRTLQLLQSRCPPRRWMLHAPVHMLSLDALDRLYPDARFVMTHRDPAAVLGSVCSLIGFMRSLCSDRRDPAGLGREQLELWPLALERAMRFRQRVGESRFADVHFPDLVADPIGAVARAYARLDLAFTAGARNRMTEWARGHRRGRHGAHRYRLSDYGLDADRVRERFDAYVQCFGTAPESQEDVA